MTSGEVVMTDLGDKAIRFMTLVIVADAPNDVFDRWRDSLGTDREHEITQSTWRIALQVEAIAGGVFASEAEDVVSLDASPIAQFRAHARLRFGARHLGKIVDRQGRELIELTDSEDVIDEDGDGDWEVVWERLHDMKRALSAAQDEIEHRISECETHRVLIDAVLAERRAETAYHALTIEHAGTIEESYRSALLNAARHHRRAVADSIGGAS